MISSDLWSAKKGLWFWRKKFPILVIYGTSPARVRQSPAESGGLWQTVRRTPLDSGGQSAGLRWTLAESGGLWRTLAGLRGPVKIIDSTFN